MPVPLFTENEFQGKTGSEIINYLAIRIYAPDMITRHGKAVFQQLPEVLQTILLVIDFDIEVSMNSILGFLENSTGLFLDETIEAFERIEATETTTILRNVAAIMAKHQTSPEDLRSNVNNLSQYAITSFFQTHGRFSREMAEEIDMVTSNLYIYKKEDREEVFVFLENYVTKELDNLLLLFRTHS